MVETIITKIEDSKYNDNKLVYFNFGEREVYSIVSNKVLRYLKVNELKVNAKINVIKSFNKQNKAIYLIKKVISNV